MPGKHGGRKRWDRPKAAGPSFLTILQVPVLLLVIGDLLGSDVFLATKFVLLDDPTDEWVC